MPKDSSKQPKANKETIKTRPENVRVTRSRAKALGSSSKPFLIQEPKVKKRMTSYDHPTEASFKHKRRAVLKDVTNCLDGSYIKLSPAECDHTIYFF
ncbi:unnamed protein product [Eruca vesicaria subsp. sativa]|uniref:Uncharacterized protein n=1 Tax=Eruca vesicaria subsp. sativa TaxID=29727 RepID=A0ABC8LIF2_ERUVS|nr:unnamed protein product [Eruca vesicaria subsp. sativa]